MVAPRQSPKVLHVDDDEMILEFVKQFVAGQDPSLLFTTTTSPSAALDLLHAQTYDCVLLDYKMPEMNGIELAQRIRATDKTPIILYTGQGSEEVAEQAYAAGIDDYIRKEAHPAHYQVLARRIRHVIEKHRTDELYRTVVESCPDGCSISRENVFIYTNHVIANIFGFNEPEEINGKNYLQWLVEEDRQTIIDRNKRFEYGEATTEIIHYRLPKPNGETRFIESHGRRVTFEGAPATLAFTRDVTNKKLIEDQLRASEERSRAISTRLTSFMNSATDEFVIYDKNLNFVDANDLWLKNHKQAREEALGKNIRDIHSHPIDDKIAEYLRVLKTGEPISYEATTEPPSGGRHEKMIRAFKVGEGVGAILVDVTNFKQMEKALVESEEKYRLLSENARDIIFRYSFTNGFEYINKAVTKVLGYTLDDIRESPLLDFNNIPLGENGKLSNLVDKIRSGKPLEETFRIRFPHKDGHFVALEFSLQPIIGRDGSLVSVEGIARDVTQSIAYEKKLEALHHHVEAIALADSMEEISKATLDTVEEVIGIHLATFMIKRDNGIISIENRRSPSIGRSLPLDGKGITVKAAREQRTIRIGDVRLDPDYIRGTSDSRSELAVPIIVEGQTIAVINLENRDPDAFTDEDQSLVEILADQISSAIKKLRLLESERDSKQKLEALHHHAVQLSSLDNLKDIAKFTLETVNSVLGHSYGGFAVVKDGRLEFLYSIGIDLSRIESIPLDGKGMTVRTVKIGKTQYAPDVRLDADYFPDGDGLTQSELDVPIKIDGNTIAIINLESNRLNAYTPEDRRMVEVLCEHVSLAIKRLELLEKERRNTARLEALHSHAVKLSDSANLQEIASFTLNTIGEVLGYRKSAFITIDGKKLRYLHLNGVDPNILPEMHIDGPGITVRAIRTAETQLILDTRDDPDYVKDADGDNRSELDVPVIVDDRVVAVIDLEDKQPNVFNETDRHIIEILSEHVALAIKRLHLLENERSNAEKLEVLNRCAAALNQSKSIMEAIDAACKILNEDFGYNWVGVGRVDEDAIRYVKYVGGTLSGNEIPFTRRTVTVRAAMSGETQLVRDTTKDPDYILLATAENPYLSELVVPVKVGRRIEYVINIESIELDGFTDERRRQIELLALHLGSAFELIRERERLAALHKHAPSIARAKDVNEIAHLLLTTTDAVFNFPIAGLHVVRGNSIELIYVPGFTENGSFTQTIDGPGLIPYAVREGKSLLIDDIRQNIHYVGGPIGNDVRLSELVVPIRLNDKITGAINLESNRVAAFTEEDRRMVELLALHVGTAMELIEEKKQIQEQQIAETRELLEGANRISNMVRHDLRGPLQSIKNATFLAEQQPEKSKEMLEAIDKSVDYATKILEDLRNSTSPIKLAKAVTNVNDLVEQSIASASIPGDINIHKSYGEGFIAASLDSTRIRRALDNLIKNAVEAMPRGGDLTVTVKKEGETVVIDVADTGVGIPKEVMESLFRPFFTTKPRGTGLGLAVCRQAVEAHGGTITLASELGKGTTFTMRLPLKG